MNDLVSLASAYRNAKDENTAAFDEMERAHTAFDAATARWEASGSSVGAARQALLNCAASGIDARQRPDREAGLDPKGESPVAATSGETPNYPPDPPQ